MTSHALVRAEGGVAVFCERMGEDEGGRMWLAVSLRSAHRCEPGHLSVGATTLITLRPGNLLMLGLNNAEVTVTDHVDIGVAPRSRRSSGGAG